MGEISITKNIGKTEYSYKILTAGSKFKVPIGLHVTLECNGKIYSAKMHSKTVGRIDGLSALYNENNIQVGDEVTLTYDEYENRIFMKCNPQWNSNANKNNAACMNSEGNSLEMKEKIISQPDLEKIFSSLDVVAIHHEYMFSSLNEAPWHTCANGNWIFYWADKPYLMDINGNNKIELSLAKNLSYALFLGMNKNGIWFMCASSKALTWDDTDWFNEIVCVDVVNNKQQKIKTNRKKGKVCAHYIYDNNIYYVTTISENRQELCEINFHGTERVLYVTHKGEEIRNVSADATRVAFEVTTKRDNDIDCWYIVDLWSKQLTQLGAKRNPKRSWLPLIKIRQIYLEQNIMWTSMTDDEKMRFVPQNGKKTYFAPEDGWIARPLKDPEEYKICTYKKDGSPAIYKIGYEDGLCYFDGRDAYLASCYFKLERRDKEGNGYEICADCHGETNRLIVTKSYVIVNYDAKTAVRLPRKFHETKLFGRHNPEASLIFGERDYRL